MRKGCLYILPLLLIFASCSNTRVLSEGQYRLAKNKVQFEGDSGDLSSSDVSSYIKQQTSNAFLLGWIYNWSDPKKDDWLNNSLRKIGSAPVVFNSGQLGGSRENIARHLDYLGYYNSTVTTQVDTVGKNVRVTYTVKPGARCRIDDIVYKVPGGEFEEEFNADTTNVIVKRGDWLSEKVLESESERGAKYFRNKGYYDLTKFNYFFEADTLGPRNVLTYEIREYTRNEPESNAAPLNKYHIGKVTVSHSESVPFREKVLRNLNIIKPGDIYSEKQANVCYNRFASLRVFNNVSVEMTPVDSTTVDCNITLGQGKFRGLKVNLEASTNSSGLLGISPAISWYNKNLFHGGEWFSLGFSGNFQRKFGTNIQANEFGYNLSLSIPRFLGLPNTLFKGPNIPRTLIQNTFNFQSRPEFVRFITSASFGYTGGSDKFFYQLYPFRTTVVKVGYLDPDFSSTLFNNYALLESFINHIDAGVGGQLYWTTDASVIPKGRYSNARFSFDISGNVISLFDPLLPVDEWGDRLLFDMTYARYVRSEINLTHCFRLSEGSRLAMRLTAGAGYAYGKDGDDNNYMPYEKMFYVGGANSMRGWQVKTLGPGADKMWDIFTIASQSGDCKMEFDLEYRKQLFWKLEGAVFAEVGNVWDMRSEETTPFVETLAGDWGLGIRLNLNFILLRLDWGMKIFEPSRIGSDRWVKPREWISAGGSALHFGVGYPF